LNPTWREESPLALNGRIIFGIVSPFTKTNDFSWKNSNAHDLGEAANWSRGTEKASRLCLSWVEVQRKDFTQEVVWKKSAGALDIEFKLLYRPHMFIRDKAVSLEFSRSDEHGKTSRAGQTEVSYIPGRQPLNFWFDGLPYTPPTTPHVYFDFSQRKKASAIRPTDTFCFEKWSAATGHSSERTFRWQLAKQVDGAQVGIAYPDYPGPVIVIEPPAEPDILETYMIANSVSIVVLPDRTPLDATNLRIGLDIDSFSWTFSADLLGRASLDLVRPRAEGQREIEVTLNGWTWRFIVERHSRQLSFPAERYAITGASRTQLLGEPYAPRRSAVNTGSVNARQAAEEQLGTTGFRLEWGSEQPSPPDWTIPAGAFTYRDQTAIQVIARLAETVGAVVRPSRSEDALTFLPRYREASWLWPKAVMDRVIPAEIVTTLGGEWMPVPQWNSCYVSGTHYGVGVDVRRAGTAGDSPAADVLDDLMTGTEAARARGICELSKGGAQELVTLAIPLFPVGGSAPGLVEPAHLCEVREPGETWRGLCLGVEITAEGVGATRVTQTLRLERHYEEAA